MLSGTIMIPRWYNVTSATNSVMNALALTLTSVLFAPKMPSKQPPIHAMPLIVEGNYLCQLKKLMILSHAQNVHFLANHVLMMVFLV